MLNIIANITVRWTCRITNITSSRKPVIHLLPLRIRPIRKTLHRVVCALQDIGRGNLTLVVRLVHEALDVCFTLGGDGIDEQPKRTDNWCNRNHDVRGVCERLELRVNQRG